LLNHAFKIVIKAIQSAYLIDKIFVPNFDFC